jgi:hypothetical protein
MLTVITNYTFSPSTKEITFTDYASINIERIHSIQNVTKNIFIYGQDSDGSSDFAGTVSGNTLTVTYDTSKMSASDKLQILYYGTNTLSNVTLSSESGFLTYRNTALTNTAVAVKATGGSVMGWNFVNPNTTPVYVKFYNIVAASVTVGTSAVTLTILVPPGDGTTPGMFFLEPDLIPIEVFSTAIAITCVTGLADNNNTAPSTAIHASVRYK